MTEWRLIKENDYNYGELGSIVSPSIKKARKENKVPDTILINRFKKPSVVYCYYINPDREINIKYCRENDISYYRVLSGGGAGVSDIGQLVTSFYVDIANYDLPKSAPDIMAKLLCDIAERLSSTLNVPVKFRPINDLTINDKKFSLCTSHIDGSIIQFRLAMQVKPFSLDVGKIIIPPPEKFADKKGKTIKEIITSIEEAAGRNINFIEVSDVILNSISRFFNVSFYDGKITTIENDYIEKESRIYGSDDFKFARTERVKFGDIPSNFKKNEYRMKIPNGPMITSTSLINDNKIQNILINGSLWVSPLEAVEKLEKLLVGTVVNESLILKKVEQIFNEADFPRLTPEKLTKIIMQSCQT